MFLALRTMVFCGVSASDASAFLPAATVAGCLPASATGAAGAAALEAVGAGFGMPGLSDIKVRGAMVFCFPFVSDERIGGQKNSVLLHKVDFWGGSDFDFDNFFENLDLGKNTVKHTMNHDLLMTRDEDEQHPGDFESVYLLLVPGNLCNGSISTRPWKKSPYPGTGTQHSAHRSASVRKTRLSLLMHGFRTMRKIPSLETRARFSTLLCRY